MTTAISQLSLNLKQLITLHGISLLTLAKQTGLPQPTLHHILSGGTRKPRREVLVALADFFAITIEQMTGIKPLPKIPEAIKARYEISTIPVVSWDMLYTWPAHRDYTAREIILDKTIHPQSFAIYMDTHHFAPMFFEKTILLFDAGKKPRNNDFVIIKKDQQFNLCRLVIKSPHVYLRLTHSGEQIEFDKTTHSMLGTLIEARLELTS